MADTTGDILSPYVKTKLLAKLGTDGFSLVLFGTKVSNSKEFCKKSTIENYIINSNCV